MVSYDKGSLAVWFQYFYFMINSQFLFIGISVKRSGGTTAPEHMDGATDESRKIVGFQKPENFQPYSYELLIFQMSE